MSGTLAGSGVVTRRLSFRWSGPALAVDELTAGLIPARSNSSWDRTDYGPSSWPGQACGRKRFARSRPSVCCLDRKDRCAGRDRQARSQTLSVPTRPAASNFIDQRLRVRRGWVQVAGVVAEHRGRIHASFDSGRRVHCRPLWLGGVRYSPHGSRGGAARTARTV